MSEREREREYNGAQERSRESVLIISRDENVSYCVNDAQLDRYYPPPVHAYGSDQFSLSSFLSFFLSFALFLFNFFSCSARFLLALLLGNLRPRASVSMKVRSSGAETHPKVRFPRIPMCCCSLELFEWTHSLVPLSKKKLKTKSPNYNTPRAWAWRERT